MYDLQAREPPGCRLQGVRECPNAFSRSFVSDLKRNQIHYEGTPARCTLPDPQRPVAASEARGIEGLMTVEFQNNVDEGTKFLYSGRGVVQIVPIRHCIPLLCSCCTIFQLQSTIQIHLEYSMHLLYMHRRRQENTKKRNGQRFRLCYRATSSSPNGLGVAWK